MDVTSDRGKQPVSATLAGPYGHPFHPILVTVPIGAWAASLVLGAGLALYATVAVVSMRVKSATFDEAAHLPAGYTYLTLRDYRLNPEHPPLVKTLAAEGVPSTLLPPPAGSPASAALAL